MPQYNIDSVALNELETSQFFSTLSIAQYSRPNPFSQGEYVPENTIKLPLPGELRDDTAVGYDNTNLELVGDIINGNTIENIAGAELLRQGGDLASRLAGSAAGFFAGQTVGNAVSDAFDGQSVGSAIQQSIGAAPNPNPSVAFSGPILRDYTLTWSLMPNNDKEAKTIDKIIRRLKAAALPRNSFSKSAAVLSYPKICQINFFPWDNNGGGRYGWSQNSIIRAKPAFMASVNVDYTAGVAPAFFHNVEKSPVMMRLIINFKEIEYHLSHDWVGDGSELFPGDKGEDAIQATLGLFREGSEFRNAIDATFVEGREVVSGLFSSDTDQQAADVNEAADT